MKIADVQSEGKYIVKVVCGGCQDVLLESVVIPGDELKESWSRLVMTKGFNTPKCPKGCPATFTDFNINSDMEIHLAP